MESSMGRDMANQVRRRDFLAREARRGPPAEGRSPLIATIPTTKRIRKGGDAAWPDDTLQPPPFAASVSLATGSVLGSGVAVATPASGSVVPPGSPTPA